MKQKIFNACLYAAAVFAAVYGMKYLIDALVYIFTNMDTMFKSAADIIIKILHVFAILVFGLLAAYILDPLANFITRKLHLRRTAAVSLIYLFMLFIIVFFIYGIIGRIYIYDKNDISNAISLALEHYRSQCLQISTHIDNIIKKYDYIGLAACIREKINGVKIDHIAVLRRIGSAVADMFLGLILAFYFLKDKKRLLMQTKHIYSLITPKKARPYIEFIVRETESVFSGYIRGQLADAVIISILASCLLTILRIPFAAIIGIITGFTKPNKIQFLSKKVLF